MTQTHQLSVIVTFSVTFDYKKYYPESDITPYNSILLDAIRNAKTIEGAIDISFGDKSTKIIDELAPWIQNLCFQPISNLCLGKEQKALYFSRSGFLDLQPLGKEIRLSGNKNPTEIYPFKELLHALVECGSRYMKIIGDIKQDDIHYMANLNYIAPQEESARFALEMLSYTDE